MKTFGQSRGLLLVLAAVAGGRGRRGPGRRRCRREHAAGRLRLAHAERPRAPDQTPDVEVRFVPLDARVTRLLAQDTWESLRSLVESRRAAIDSVAHATASPVPAWRWSRSSASAPNARFDPQTLTVMARSREFRPLGIVPFSGQFTSQQLNVREQVSGIFLFEEDLPVNDSFTFLYAGMTSDDWQGKQRTLDRERARVASRERASVRETTTSSSGGADSVATDSGRRTARAEPRSDGETSKGHAPRVPLRRVQARVMVQDRRTPA